MFPLPLPYETASPWQQRQAVFSACQVLEPAFPYLVRADWQRALDLVQPALYAVADQVLLTHDGLAQLTHHLAAYVPVAAPRPAAGPPARRPGTPRPSRRPCWSN